MGNREETELVLAHWRKTTPPATVGYEFVFLDTELEDELDREVARAEKEAGGFTEEERYLYSLQILEAIGKRETTPLPGDSDEEIARKRALLDIH